LWFSFGATEQIGAAGMPANDLGIHSNTGGCTVKRSKHAVQLRDNEGDHLNFASVIPQITL